MNEYYIIAILIVQTAVVLFSVYLGYKLGKDMLVFNYSGDYETEIPEDEVDEERDEIMDQINRIYRGEEKKDKDDQDQSNWKKA